MWDDTLETQEMRYRRLDAIYKPNFNIFDLMAIRILPILAGVYARGSKLIVINIFIM